MSKTGNAFIGVIPVNIQVSNFSDVLENEKNMGILLHGQTDTARFLESEYFETLGFTNTISGLVTTNDWN